MNKLSQLQKQYDTMVSIAKSSMDNGVKLTPQFKNELVSLTNLVRSMGGRVW
jgi:hypothetical protein